jgi:Uma2 family endonuclease
MLCYNLPYSRLIDVFGVILLVALRLSPPNWLVISEQEWKVMSLETEYELYAEEEEMPESNLQLVLMIYLIGVLKYWYADEGWFVGGNLMVKPPDATQYTRSFKSLSPDVLVCHGVVLSEAEEQALTSWDMNEPNRPAPSVVFEICSNSTWQIDLDRKPGWYGQIGVREYFAFDPQQFWRGSNVHLRGWRYVNGLPMELETDERGRLWSVTLDSYVVPDGIRLRLTDRRGRQRLTEKEASEVAQREAERARRKAEREARAAQQARQQAEQRLEAERLAKEAAWLEVQELREKLKQLSEGHPQES